MSRGSAIVTDDFNRASLGSNWAQLYPSGGSLSISDNDNLSFPGGDYHGIRWVGAGSFNDDQWAEADYLSLNWNNEHVGVVVRASGVDSTRTFYGFRIFDNDWTIKTLQLVKVVNGTLTTLASTTYATGANGTMSMEVETSGGNAVLRCFIGTTQITALNYTDSTSPIASGTPGIAGVGNNGISRIDNFSAGNWGGGGSPPIAAFLRANQFPM